MKIDKLKKVMKGPVLWGVLFLILVFSLYVITDFRQRIVDAATFRDRMIKYDYEGTQQETSGFINLLTPEIFRDFNPESLEEKTTYN
ncbi:MAG: hypothetical protein QG657_4063 [Acidobacteriota bacterium]|nr:hypothetical protein [Acidobacteriota bacterium]